MDIPLTNLWTAAGILLGFQVSSFTARITREVTIWEQKGHPTWLPPADIIESPLSVRPGLWHLYPSGIWPRQSQIHEICVWSCGALVPWLSVYFGRSL